MTATTPCPVATCMWLPGKASTPPAPDGTVEVLPWCLPTWEVESGGYGSCLTAAQVIAAHVATHPVAERSGRMPSRAEVVASGTGTTT